MLVSTSEWTTQEDEITNVLDGNGTIEMVAKHKFYKILRVHAPSETFMYFVLKYGSDLVWKR